MAETKAPGTKTVPRRAELAVVLGLITAIGPLSIDMYLPAFPQIAADFDVPDAQVQLSLTACLIGLAVGQLTFGPLSDRWGRRRPIVAAVATYAIFSLLCAVAPSAPVLVVFRLLQGLAGGAGLVVARALVRDLYSGVAAAKFFSQLTLIFGVAPIAAPSLGSAVLRVTSWHGIFVTLGAIALVLTLLVSLRLPETLPPERRSAGGLADTARTARTLVKDKIYLGYALSQAFAGPRRADGSRHRVRGDLGPAGGADPGPRPRSRRLKRGASSAPPTRFSGQRPPDRNGRLRSAWADGSCRRQNRLLGLLRRASANGAAAGKADRMAAAKHVSAEGSGRKRRTIWPPPLRLSGRQPPPAKPTA